MSLLPIMVVITGDSFIDEILSDDDDVAAVIIASMLVLRRNSHFFECNEIRQNREEHRTTLL